jgi:hypothetical protein
MLKGTEGTKVGLIPAPFANIPFVSGGYAVIITNLQPGDVLCSIFASIDPLRNNADEYVRNIPFTVLDGRRKRTDQAYSKIVDPGFMSDAGTKSVHSPNSGTFTNSVI